MIFINEESVKMSNSQRKYLENIAEELDLNNDDSEVTVNFDAVPPEFEMSDEELGLNEDENWEEGDDKLVNEAALSTSRKVVIKTKKQKLARLAQSAAMALAKDANDPIFAKYEKFRKLEIKFRKIIEKKYRSKGKAAARAIASGINQKKEKNNQ